MCRWEVRVASFSVGRWLALPIALALAVCLTGTAWAQGRVHVVQPGENLFRISLRYGVTVNDLMRANGLTSTRIYAGQTLVIPGSAASPASAAPAESVQPQPAASATPGEPVYHIVQRGETLFTIGLRYNLPWTRIALANGIHGERVYAGQRLLIPVAGAPPSNEAAPTPAPAAESGSPPAAPQAEAPPASGGNLTHTVRRGETLFTIGLRYNLRWTTIMAANNLPNERIYVGQQLIIPVGAAAIEAAQAATLAPVVSKSPVPGYTGKYFLVDLSEQRLYAFEGETLVRSTAVSTGRRRTPTVTGTFQIYAKYVSTRMRGPGYDLPNVPYTMYFYKGYGLHGTYWHNNFGTPMSHGCVNMPTPEAEWAFNWAPLGTTVIVQP
ncbi:MAG: LysM peptidoglycan-binding domain-containing protein [Anaerolineales bacterium]|nr:LysM peptidoglycan-binding domain-containing protein [Anaerolineales bacterium]